MQIIKVPGINGSGTTQGCETSCNAVIGALKETHSNEQGKLIDSSLLDLEEIHIDNLNLELTNKLIYKNSLDTFETKPKVVFLGGDHSITYSIVKAFLDYCNDSSKEPCLIVFDARPDLTQPRKEPTHNQWLRALIDAGFPTSNILLVGIRNSYVDEIKFIKSEGIKMISINRLLEDIKDSCEVIMEFSSGKELYLSIDMGVVDPTFAPATGQRDGVGGLTSRQLIYLMQRLNKIKRLRAIDIVEINAEKDKRFNGLTVKLGAKILSEFL